MGRNDAADDFADCVAKRTGYDTVARTSLMLAIMVIPVAVGCITALLMMRSGMDSFDIARDGKIIATIGIATECTIASYLLFMMTRRSRRHQKRDIVWMNALADYAESQGADVRKLRDLSKAASKRKGSVNYTTSGMIWLFSALYLVLVGIMSYQKADIINEHMLMIAGASYILVLIQFILSAGSTSRFPGRHDRIQCEFTGELSKSLRSAGIYSEPMRRSAGNLHPAINTFLFIITLGLFSIPLVIKANVELNRHIKTQWKYESDMLTRIIKAQGATGIEIAPASDKKKEKEL